MKDFKKSTENELLALLEQPKSLKEPIAEELLKRSVSNEILLYIIKEFSENREICVKATRIFWEKENLTNGDLRVFIENIPWRWWKERAIIRLCGRHCEEEDLIIIMTCSCGDPTPALQRLAELRKKRKNLIVTEPHEEICRPLL